MTSRRDTLVQFSVGQLVTYETPRGVGMATVPWAEAVHGTNSDDRMVFGHTDAFEVRWLGDVSIPRGLEVIRVQRNHLLTIRTDELDREEIHILRLLKPEGALP